MDRIVVTATRREQLLRNVPLSVFVIPGKKLLETGAASFIDYADAVPGLSYVGSSCNGSKKITIRGISSDGLNAELRPLTAMYFDETPVTHASGFNGVTLAAYSPDPELVDIERIEVLRGPQGTLFGEHAMGGAIRIIPAAPNPHAAYGFAAAETKAVGETGFGTGVQAMGNQPVVGGRGAVRAVGFWRQADGFLDNLASNTEDVNNNETGGGRLSGRYDWSDSLRLTGKVVGQSRHSDGSEWDDAGTPVDQQFRRVPEPRNDRWALYNFVIDSGGEDFRTIASSSYLDRRTDFHIDLTPFISAAFGTDVPAWGAVKDTFREFTQELRFQTDADRTVDWLTGLFFQTQDFGGTVDFPSPGFDAATGNQAADAGLPDNLGHRDYGQELRHYAAFADASYRFAEEWEAGAGARVFSIEQEFDVANRGLLLTTPAQDAGSSHESGVTPRVSVQYQPDPRLSLYTNAAKGFRPGGINSIATLSAEPCATDPAVASVPQAFESDSLWSYELGAKTRWLEDRLYVNAAVFHIDWSDLQTASRLQCGFSYVDNAGKAKSNGVELELTALPFDSVELGFQSAYTDTYFAEDAPQRNALRGDSVPSAPRYTLGANVTYSLPRPGAFARVDYQNRADTPNEIDASVAAGKERMPGYEMTNLRLVWPFGKFETTLAVRNVFDTRAAHSTFVNPILGQVDQRVPPRTFSLGARYPF